MIFHLQNYYPKIHPCFANNILNSKKNPERPEGEKDNENDDYKKGRGAQFNTPNRFDKWDRNQDFIEAVDDWADPKVETQFIEVEAKSIVNKVDSPDVAMWYSMNPYMGCEHGCIYCYARNSFEYWGYSAGT